MPAPSARAAGRSSPPAGQASACSTSNTAPPRSTSPVSSSPSSAVGRVCAELGGRLPTITTALRARIAAASAGPVKADMTLGMLGVEVSFERDIPVVQAVAAVVA